jgi:surface protein
MVCSYPAFGPAGLISFFIKIHRRNAVYPVCRIPHPLRATANPPARKDFFKWLLTVLLPFILCIFCFGPYFLSPPVRALSLEPAFSFLFHAYLGRSAVGVLTSYSKVFLHVVSVASYSFAHSVIRGLLQGNLAPRTPPVASDAIHTSLNSALKSNTEYGNVEWPTDVLQLFLHALAVQCDTNAQNAWHQLAYMTCKRYDLARLARDMPRPILLRIDVGSRTASMFKIPFMQATVVCVDVDWGDGYVDQLREKRAGYVEHTYATPGEYVVRIFPQGKDHVSLDHLGFQENASDSDTIAWWRPLREIVSFGTCGLRSLSYLFLHCNNAAFIMPSLSSRFGITDLSGLFYGSNFNRPIGQWDVSRVTNMCDMFSRASLFNQPIGGWNVSQVTDMSRMFLGAFQFNQPIGIWNVSNVTNMTFMFHYASSFNQPIGEWNVSNVTDMSDMFGYASVFNQPIGQWNTHKVRDMKGMFFSASSFDQPIGDWNVSYVTSMYQLFGEAIAFNQPIGSWDVSNVVDMSEMFSHASAFSQDISAWNVSNVKNMSLMFQETSFNQPIGGWDVSNVTDMNNMFRDAVFNQPIGDWDVSNVIDMTAMFYGATAFNQSIGKWNVGQVKSMAYMFCAARAFNQPIGDWNVHNVGNMERIFYGAVSFNQPSVLWKPSS